MTTLTLAKPRPFRFDLARHDLRAVLPANVQAMMQNGLLDRMFRDALVPDFLFPATASLEPVSQGIGATLTFTRDGLLTPTTTPTTGSDPTPQSVSIEQWSAIVEQYSGTVDTNRLTARATLADTFVRNVKKLGIQAGQSLNRLSRDRLYGAYGGGNTWVTTAQGSASTTCVIHDTAGFTTVMSNGTLVPVSAGTPLAVTVNGVANTVTAINTGTKTLTLGTAVTQAIGDNVLSAAAPYSLRPNAKASRYNLAGSDVMNAAVVRSAVARLRTENVPTINGNYIGHIDPTTEAQLFADTDWKQAYQGRGDSAVFGDMSLGTFLNVDWVRNNETPTTTDGGSAGNLLVHRPIFMGAEALMANPFEGISDLLAETGVENVPYISMIGPADGVQVAMIIRPPQDRLQQIIAGTWSWVGDFAVPSDITTGDPALYKRAVVIEHT
jgi:N4-gp56 family major capsid protein